MVDLQQFSRKLVCFTISLPRFSIIVKTQADRKAVISHLLFQAFFVFRIHSDESTVSGHHCHSVFVIFTILFVCVVLISKHFKIKSKKNIKSIRLQYTYTHRLSNLLKQNLNQRLKYNGCILLCQTQTPIKRRTKEEIQSRSAVQSYQSPHSFKHLWQFRKARILKS